MLDLKNPNNGMASILRYQLLIPAIASCDLGSTSNAGKEQRGQPRTGDKGHHRAAS